MRQNVVRTNEIDIVPNPLLEEGFDKLVKFLPCSSTLLFGYYVFYEAANWDDTGAKQIGSGLQVQCVEL